MVPISETLENNTYTLKFHFGTKITTVFKNELQQEEKLKQIEHTLVFKNNGIIIFKTENREKYLNLSRIYQNLMHPIAEFLRNNGYPIPRSIETEDEEEEDTNKTDHLLFPKLEKDLDIEEKESENNLEEEFWKIIPIRINEDIDALDSIVSKILEKTVKTAEKNGGLLHRPIFFLKNNKNYSIKYSTWHKSFSGKILHLSSFSINIYSIILALENTPYERQNKVLRYTISRLTVLNNKLNAKIQLSNDVFRTHSDYLNNIGFHTSIFGISIATYLIAVTIGNTSLQSMLIIGAGAIGIFNILLLKTLNMKSKVITKLYFFLRYLIIQKLTH